jgi:perosamine synthetase
MSGEPTIPYGRHWIEEDDVEAVAQVLRGDWLTQGPTVAEFESAFAAVCDAPYAVAFSSGTAALHGAAFAIGLSPGDEAITSGLTFAASANCAAYLGATPRFADIDPATLNVSAGSVAAAAGEHTRAVIPVHFAGLPAPVREIRQRLGPDVAVIEDAAHAFGARTDAGPIGACIDSEMAVFSLHPVKAIAAGEGGMVTTRDPELRDRLASFRNHGLRHRPAPLERDDGPWYYEQHDLGFNYRLSDIHSALGLSQLSKLERFVKLRNEVAARYRDWLGGLEELELAPVAPAGTRQAYHLFVVRHRRGAEPRRRLYDGLRERGILAQVHYVPVYLHPWYERTYGYGPGLCPETERYYSQCLSLPCYPSLGEADQRRVADAVIDLVG